MEQSVNIADAFSRLRFARFGFVLRPIGELRLPPYKGSTFRGAFMHWFRKTICVTRLSVCAPCILKDKCIYCRIFETENSDQSPGFLSNVRRVPHPFVLEPPLDRRTIFQQDDALTVNVILVGSAIDYLPYFIYAFEQMGAEGMLWRGRFRLVQVTSIGARGDSVVVYDGQDKQLASVYETTQLQDVPLSQPDVGRLHLEFLTPTRIVYQNRLTMDITFPILVQSLWRRLAALECYFCGGDAPLKPPPISAGAEVEIASRALEWHDWERYSNRQKTKMKLGGFVGEIELGGNIAPYHSLLQLGKFLHIGKGTAFGLGQFTVA